MTRDCVKLECARGNEDWQTEVVEFWTARDKYQLSLMNPHGRRTLHHGERAANKGGRSV